MPLHRPCIFIIWAGHFTHRSDYFCPIHLLFSAILPDGRAVAIGSSIPALPFGPAFVPAGASSVGAGIAVPLAAPFASGPFTGCGIVMFMVASGIVVFMAASGNVPFMAGYINVAFAATSVMSVGRVPSVVRSKSGHVSSKNDSIVVLSPIE